MESKNAEKMSSGEGRLRELLNMNYRSVNVTIRIAYALDRR